MVVFGHDEDDDDGVGMESNLSRRRSSLRCGMYVSSERRSKKIEAAGVVGDKRENRVAEGIELILEDCFGCFERVLVCVCVRERVEEGCRFGMAQAKA
jgi:hypothetical protein